MSGNNAKGHEEGPSPVEIEEILRSEKFDSERAKRIVFTPRCWKPGCYDHGAFYRCQQCDRNFHRRCVKQLGDAFPDPKFDVSLEDAMRAKYGKVVLRTCSVCRILKGEGTEMEKNAAELHVELKKLMSMFKHHYTSVANMEVPLEKTISEKVENKQYKTVDHFMIDIRQMQYDFVCQNRNANTELEKLLSNAVEIVEINAVILRSCLKCFSGLITPKGEVVGVHDFRANSLRNCEKLHLLLWIKEPSFPYWPAKVFASQNESIFFISFRGNAWGLRRLSLNEQNVTIKEFTKAILDEQLKLKATSQTRRTQAIKDAQEYLEICCPTVGSSKSQLKSGVEAEKLSPDGSFDGDYDAAMRRMRNEWESASSG